MGLEVVFMHHRSLFTQINWSTRTLTKLPSQYVILSDQQNGNCHDIHQTPRQFQQGYNASEWTNVAIQFKG